MLHLGPAAAQLGVDNGAEALGEIVELDVQFVVGQVAPQVLTRLRAKAFASAVATSTRGGSSQQRKKLPP